MITAKGLYYYKTEGTMGRGDGEGREKEEALTKLTYKTVLIKVRIKNYLLFCQHGKAEPPCLTAQEFLFGMQGSSLTYILQISGSVPDLPSHRLSLVLKFLLLSQGADDCREPLSSEHRRVRMAASVAQQH